MKILKKVSKIIRERYPNMYFCVECTIHGHDKLETCYVIYTEKELLLKNAETSNFSPRFSTQKELLEYVNNEENFFNIQKNI